MEKKTKIIIGVGVALAAAAGVYFAITKGWFGGKDEAADETASDSNSSSSSSTNASTTSSSTSKSSTPAITLKKSPSKSPVFSGEPKKTSAPTVVTSNSTSSSNSKPLYVFSNANGVKVYKQSKNSKGVITLGSVYNTYNKGAVIGVYTGHTSIGGKKFALVDDAGSKIIVSESLTYKKTK